VLKHFREIFSLVRLKTLWVYPATLDIFLHNTAILNTLKKFAELDHNVTFISVRSRQVYKTENALVRMYLVPLRFVPLVSPVIFGIILFFYLPILIIVSKPDLVIMMPDFSIISSIPGLLVSKLKKTKFVLDVRSIPVETAGLRGSLQKYWFLVSLLIAKKFFEGITIITPLMKREICHSFTLKPDKVGVWTSGVSGSLFNPKNVATKILELKGKLGLTDKFVVFYHGVFAPSRGLIETINAIKILRRKHPNIVFFLLGTGPIVAMLKLLIRRNALEDNVIISNPVNQLEVPNFVGMCDVSILPLPDHPYWRYQSPLKLLEYLAMEKVVILTDLPAHRAVIGKAKCGIYTSSIKPKEIAEAIEYAYSNKENLEEWGRIGREIVIERFTWEKVVKDLENYLLSI
jgi:glycosyltransferase involved in cell wall biosynthesis